MICVGCTRSLNSVHVSTNYHGTYQVSQIWLDGKLIVEVKSYNFKMAEILVN